MLREALESEGRWEEVREALRALYRRIDRSEGDGFSFDGAYLITLGAKPG